MGELNQTLERLWYELLLTQQRDSSQLTAAALAQHHDSSHPRNDGSTSAQLLQDLLRPPRSSLALPLCSATPTAGSTASGLDRLLRTASGGPATVSLPPIDNRAMLPPSAFPASSYGRQSSLPAGAGPGPGLSVFDICAAAANVTGDALARRRGSATAPDSRGCEAVGTGSGSCRPSKPSPSPRALTEHEKFVVLVKIVLKCLDRSGDPVLKQRVKVAVADCTKRNRQGDPAYTPLLAACERRLRRTVGELYWTRAQLLYHRYCQRQGMAPRPTPRNQPVGV